MKNNPIEYGARYMNELTKATYGEVVDIIKAARERAFSKVNEELI